MIMFVHYELPFNSIIENIAFQAYPIIIQGILLFKSLHIGML